jgi:hypothetical protein
VRPSKARAGARSRNPERRGGITLCGARGRSRTVTPLSGPGILSPVRLPVSPPGRGAHLPHCIAANPDYQRAPLRAHFHPSGYVRFPWMVTLSGDSRRREDISTGELEVQSPWLQSCRSLKPSQAVIHGAEATTDRRMPNRLSDVEPYQRFSMIFPVAMSLLIASLRFGQSFPRVQATSSPVG